MKKIFALPVLALLVVLFCTAARAAALGDVDGDGGITAYDARLALRAAVHLEPAVAPETEAYIAADTDFDGVLTSEDARAILRAAVKLEDLNDRLPESAALPEEEIRQKLEDCILSFTAQRTGFLQFYGFAIDENGTVVIPYMMIKKAIDIQVNKTGCEVESVLYTDPGSNLALLKVTGDVPCIPVNRTWFNNGDPVYAASDTGLLIHGEITPMPVVYDPVYPEADICALLKKSGGSVGRPMADRFGRAIGIILENKMIGMTHYTSAIPLSKLPDPQSFRPRSVEEFVREEWRVSIECPVSRIEIPQYGVAAIPLKIEGAIGNNIIIENPDLEKFEVTIENVYQKLPFLRIYTKEPCSDIPVKLRIEGVYNTSEITLTVSVVTDTDGALCITGLPFVPDPGPLWGVVPSTSTFKSSTFLLKYYKKPSVLSNEEMFYSYVDVLVKLGYEHTETVKYSDSCEYLFRFRDTDFYITYVEEKELVKISGCTYTGTLWDVPAP